MLAMILVLIYIIFAEGVRFLACDFFNDFWNGFRTGFGSILYPIWDLLGASGVDPRTNFRLSCASSRVFKAPFSDAP